jgi:hypothetical protein
MVYPGANRCQGTIQNGTKMSVIPQQEVPLRCSLWAGSSPWASCEADRREITCGLPQNGFFEEEFD